MSECNHSPTVQLWALTNDNKCPVCLAARLAEAELSRDSWKREAEMNAEFGDQLHAALETLKAHSIHLTEKWCWCGPTVESHADSAELVQK